MMTLQAKQFEKYFLIHLNYLNIRPSRTEIKQCVVPHAASIVGLRILMRLT